MERTKSDFHLSLHISTHPDLLALGLQDMRTRNSNDRIRGRAAHLHHGQIKSIFKDTLLREIHCKSWSKFVLLACVPRYLVGRERMFLLGPIQYKAEYNVRNTKQNFMQNLTYSYLLQLCARVDIYNKELNLNIWRSKLSDKLKVAWKVSFWEGYCLWIRRCEVNIAKGTTAS